MIKNMAYRDQQQQQQQQQQQRPSPHHHLLPHTTSHQLSLPKLRLKPSTSKLRAEHSPATSASTTPTPTTATARRLLHEHTFSSSRRAESPVLQHPRRSHLPKPMSVITSPTMTPVTMLKPRSSPPSRTYPAFGSTATTSSPEKRPRTLLRRKPSSSSVSFSITSLRTGSTTSFGASTASITSSSSLVGGSRNASQSSILGIPLPPTSSNVPKLRPRDFQPPPTRPDSRASSSASTRRTESPAGGVSYSSTPSSISSSHSPGFPPPGHHRFRNPTPPVRNNLDSVRESTTSTSSGSTIRANQRDEDSDDEDGGVRTGIQHTTPPVRSQEGGYFQLSSVSAPTTPFYHHDAMPGSSPRIAPQPSPSPLLLSASYSKTPSPAPAVRGRKNSASSSTSSRLGTPELAGVSRGLGVSIPPPPPPLPPNGRLTKGRSKSLSSGSGFSLPTRAVRKETATPPPPPPPRKNSYPIARGPTPQPRDPIAIQAALTRHVSSHRGDSKERSGREKSPTRSSPGKSSRPSFFLRGRTKTAESLEEKEKEKEKRKGPVAGTGHEGYAAFAKQGGNRGRSGSTGASSIGSYVRSGSTSSTLGGIHGRTAGSRRGSASGEPDDYMRDRLKPVVIVGGGAVVENRNTGESMIRTGSAESWIEKRSLEIGKRGPSSVVMSREGSSDSIFKLPGRNNTPKLSPSPGPDPLPRKSGRWNFLRGSQSSSQRQATPAPALAPVSAPAPPITPVPTLAGAPPVVTTRKSIHASRRQPHYAILDQEELREAAQVAEQVQELRQKHTTNPNNYASAIRQQGGIHSPAISQMATPSPPPASIPTPPPPPPPALLPPTPISSPPPLSKSAPPNAAEQVRKEVRAAKANERKYFQRLQQVGRIPPVSRSQTPAPTGVPAPHPRNKPMQKLPPIQTQILRAEVELNTAPPRMDRPFEDGFRRANERGFQVPWGSYGLTPTTAIYRPRASFEIDPLDVRAARAAAMAVEVPDDAIPVVRVEVEEADDFWPEYNDLLDEGMFGETMVTAAVPEVRDEVEVDVETDASGTKSTTSSLGSPFRYEDLCSAFPDLRDDDEGVKLNAEEIVEKRQEGGVHVNDSPTLRNAVPTLALPTPLPIITSPPFTPPASRILSPGTPFSVSSFIRSYGDDRDSRITVHSTHLESSPPTSDLPMRTKRSHKSRSSNGSSGSHRSSIGSVDVDASQDEMTVRLWALKTSRWLSFDRVLVSPAHEMMESIETTAVGQRSSGGGRVLVVDGLGTDDWSFYCALSYPSAKIYNLSPSLSSNSHATPPSPSRPQNHQQIHHENLSSSFPFPKGFFNVISFRFLPSSSDSSLQFILSECRRVLEPGGTLECTVLDIDLLGNTGPKARAAVTLAKTIMARENPTFSPPQSRPQTQSERVLKVLQKRGFTGLNMCFVALPVVSSTPVQVDVVNPGVLARVARWWYTRCYERVITNQGESMARSMWNERGLLAECRERGTAFRMLVAYVRKC